MGATGRFNLTQQLTFPSNVKPTMKIDVTKSYLDVACAVIDTQIQGKDSDDAIFGLMSCTYIYSYLALVSFASIHLHQIWNEKDNRLRLKYTDCLTFEVLMASPLRDVKSALKELAEQQGIAPLHKERPEAWRQLNEVLKRHRDFFIHPNPDKFSDFIDETGNLQWNYASSTASIIIGYFFEARIGKVPEWVGDSFLISKGFEVKYLTRQEN
jgi:hypothetical protein